MEASPHLEKIVLVNFRGFEKHEVSFKDTTFIVGKNNAGKTSLIEALRVLSIFTQRFSALHYQPSPLWLEGVLGSRGFNISLDDLDLNFQSLFNHYSSPPAQIKAIFTNKTVCTIFLGPNGANHILIRKRESHSPINSSAEKRQIELPLIACLPQVAPLAAEESLLSVDHVRRKQFSRLASQHFRNQILKNPEHYQEFKALAEKTWPGLSIDKLMGPQLGGNPGIELLVRDRDFESEIGWMGHGLQVWLQIVWFLARTKEYDSIILDEPDVYLHADMQRTLARVLSNLATQTIVTTHSAEVLAEAKSEEVLILDRYNNKSVFAANLQGVQELLENIGSVHVVQSTRLAYSKKALLVEGKDVELLKRFHRKLFPHSKVPLDTIPNFQIGGWSGFDKIELVPKVLRNLAGEQISCYCLLDRDYHTDEQIAKRYEKAELQGIRLHIWTAKEIENYVALDFGLIADFVVANRIKGVTFSKEEIELDLIAVAVSLAELTKDCIGEEIDKCNKKLGYMAKKAFAHKIWECNTKTQDDLVKLLPGKELIARIRERLKTRYGISYTYDSFVSMSTSAIPDEIRSVLSAIEVCSSFEKREAFRPPTIQY